MPPPEDYLIGSETIANVAEISIEDLHLLDGVGFARRVLG
jgi:hypothetical protein